MSPTPTSPVCCRRSSPTVCCGNAGPALTPSPDTGTPFACSCDSPHERLGKAPSKLSLEGSGRAFIGDFLDHLEKERGNGARSRNTRLAAIHSFFHYVSFQEPAHADQCRRILAIPSKRYERRLIEYLTPEEIDALLAAPDRATWIGRRDRALLLVGIQTGLRVSELIGLRRYDVILGTGAHVRCEGKGRKQRCTPLRQEAVEVLAQWLRECPAEPATPVFPSSRGGPLSRDAVERLVARHQRQRRTALPLAEAKESDAARAPPYRGHATASTRH